MAITPLQPGAAPANPDAHSTSRRKVLGLFAAAPIVFDLERGREPRAKVQARVRAYIAALAMEATHG